MAKQFLKSPAFHDLVSWVTGFLFILASLTPALAIPMKEDPNGFQGIAWGTDLASIDELELFNTWKEVQEYRFKTAEPRFGPSAVNDVKLSSIQGKFARVYIEYRGEQTHERVLAYLQNAFGRAEQMPGSMVRGLNQQYTWRGPNTDINMTYQGMGKRGFIYFESRELAPRFTDYLPEGAF